MFSEISRKIEINNFVAGSFDWSVISEQYPYENILTLFREPVSRAVSQFHYLKSQNRTEGTKFRKYSIV